MIRTRLLHSLLIVIVATFIYVAVFHLYHPLSSTKHFIVNNWVLFPKHVINVKTSRKNTDVVDIHKEKVIALSPSEKRNGRMRNFKEDWYRIHESRFDWRNLLSPCRDIQWDAKRYMATQITDASKSMVTLRGLRPAGEFSKIFIHSRTGSGAVKNIGGDSWRVRVTGTATMLPTVFDHRNGTYEILFLPLDPGPYVLHIYLDYSLCDGLRDPPVNWYAMGNIQGKNQPDGSLKEKSPYLMQPFGNGQPIVINIERAEYDKVQLGLENFRNNLQAQQKGISKQFKCESFMWDGFGRWINNTWKPFVLDKAKNEPHSQQGTLWIYGDSVSLLFSKSLTTGKFYEICKKNFKSCQNTYSWVYNMDGYSKVPNQEPLPDGKDFNHTKVIEEIKKVMNDVTMDEHSVLMLNWGIHFVATVNFSSYKKLIDDFIETVRHERNLNKFKGKIIWRTTTAIYRERFPRPHRDVRRFLTFPRILLYNAYATSTMCKAGVEVLDVYPITYAFPYGTMSSNDPVHYDKFVFESVEELLHEKFKSIKPKNRFSQNLSLN